ncbi:MAG TPA: hypothetical protein VHU84_12340 [Lacipirellulaceae bacterium]|nr:hypothetical protein [Lacipirellulaceae bacterium]
MMRWLGAALSIAVVAGCQNNSERDLIARDRRVQEDQIFALQDYITQYQRLLCQYRTENASLKRQMADGYAVEPQSTAPERALPSRLNNPATKPTPHFQTPEPPGVKQQQLPSTTPGSPAPRIETPDVPPLKSTTMNESAIHDNYRPNASSEREQTSSPVVAASYEEPVRKSAASRLAHSINIKSPSAGQPSSEAMLSGEVIANKSGGGPRLMIDVVPPSIVEASRPFDGSVSLMLLAIDEDGKQRTVGSWDYGSEDVLAAMEMASGQPTLRFFIELPAKTARSDASQLWVRLAPRDGAKIVAHANVNLAQPGIFSSRSSKTWPREEAVVAASYEQETTTPAAPATDVPAVVNDTTWAIAQPGKPANLPAEARDESGAGGWRTSSEPMPVPIAQSHEIARPRLANAPPRRKPAPAPVADKPISPPGWSPERTSDGTHRVADRPNWSATRQ